MKLLSIIIPVYNVEEYLRTCVESVFRQGLDEECFEVIIVNDGTQDHSMEMIADIITQHSNVIIINQQNQSLSVARNNGIAKAKGEYIIMPDSDDLLIEFSLPPLLKKAIETKVDLVVADFLAMTNDDIGLFQGVAQREITFQEKTGEQLFLEDLDPHQCYVWRTLYRRSFLLENCIRFIPCINYQDVPFTHECYLKAKRCLKSSQLLYLYRFDRPGAASSSFSTQAARSFCIAIENTWKLTLLESLPPNVRYKLEEDLYCSFSIMMYKSSYCIKTASERRLIASFIKKDAPNLNFTHGLRQKFTTFLIKKMPYTFFELCYIYAQIVYRKVFIPSFIKRIFHKQQT